MFGNRITAWSAVTRYSLSRGSRPFLNTLKIIFVGILAQFFCIGQGHTAERSITLLISEGKTYVHVADQLHKDLSRTGGLTLHQLGIGELSYADELNTVIKDSELIIAVGTQAVRFLAEHHPDTAVLAIFTTSYSFTDAVAELPANEHRFFGLFIDQPLERYMHLVHLLLPEAKTLAITGLAHNNGVVAQCGFNFETASIAGDSNPIRLLESLFVNSDAFLVIPNTSATNRNSAKWILYLASRHKKAVIAFSEKYVTGGALAAVYAAPDDIADEAGTIVKTWLSSEVPAVPWRKTGSQFSVKTNNGIARYLRLKPDSNTRLEEQLKNLDQKHACHAEGAE